MAFKHIHIFCLSYYKLIITVVPIKSQIPRIEEQEIL